MGTTDQRQVRAALGLLTPKKARSFAKARIGGKCDGGYVMLDDLEPSGGIAYSLGVGPDVTWDMDMASRGWTVHQYDHTVAMPPSHHENFTFHKIGIAGNDTTANLRRLDTLMKENGSIGRTDNILKIDIEGHEWASLDVMNVGFFGHFKQIVAELHWLDHLHSERFINLYTRVIGNICITHQCIHVHANNYADFTIVSGIPLSPVIEITLVRKKSLRLCAE